MHGGDAMLGYWLKKPGVREVEVIKEVKVTETIYRTNTIQVPVTSNAPVQARPLQTGETNQFLASRGVPVVTNRTAASQLGLTQVNPGQQDARDLRSIPARFVPGRCRRISKCRWPWIGWAIRPDRLTAFPDRKPSRH